MIRVVLLGFGHVGSNLFNSLNNNHNISIIQVFTRNKIQNADSLSEVECITKLSALVEADVYIIAVPDDAISDFSSSFPLKNKLVVHTSGSVALKKLASKHNRGVFYPLQSFTTSHVVSFTEIPICIEAENSKDLALLRELGEAISEKVVEISSEERQKLHLAAVFVNNFVNHIYQISETYLDENKLDFDLLKPLIKETARKIESMTPSEAQTGPAKRNDLKTIEKHLHLLKDSPYKKLYKQLTEAIQDTYGKQL